MAREHSHPHEQRHDHQEHGRPGHTHGVVDATIMASARGLWALTWSFAGLLATGLLQLAVVALSGSVALLADTIHNFADAATAIPLGIAFVLQRRPPSRRFTYGLGRVEDLAGLAIVATIFASAVAAAWESLARLLEPRPVTMLGAVMAASVIGFLGNEAVAIFRIRVGRQIGSAALVADGYHARVDGWTSLAVLVGALGVWAGFPIADPVVGLLISLAIFAIVWQSAREMVVRTLDGIDPVLLETIEHAAQRVDGVEGVSEARARWVGHELYLELNVTVPAHRSVEDGHAVATEVRHQLLHHVPHLTSVTVHVDPSGKSGERHHRIAQHQHGDLPPHAHP